MKYLLALLSLAATLQCTAQIIPAENAVVNYRLAGFSVPERKEAGSYLFEIATDSVTDEKTFKKNIIIKHNDDSHRFIETLPEWGKQYTWRVSFLDKKKKVVGKTDLYHFATGYTVQIDTNKFRLRVVTNKMPNKNMLVFIDATKALYDLNGNPVWFIPKKENLTVPDGPGVRDLKLTPQNTITFITLAGAYEISYNGKVLWSMLNGPRRKRDDTAENYHHEFTRLHNGHYMIAGNERVFFPMPPDVQGESVSPKNPTFKRSGDTLYRRVECGTLLEFDAQGKLLWIWKSADYFSLADLTSRRTSAPNAKGMPDVRTHMNAFYFDEDNNNIYISYRDVNRIVKIKYPSGKVITSYGENFVPGEYRQGNGMFCTQHACRLNSDGNLLIFNNNAPTAKKDGKVSTVLILKEPKTHRDTLKKIWEFSCDFDTLADTKTTSGGNAVELQDKSLMVSMGSTNRCFVVTPDKEVLWNAFIEMRVKDETKWRKYSSYRLYPIEDKKVLEKLIFDEK